MTWAFAVGCLLSALGPQGAEGRASGDGVAEQPAVRVVMAQGQPIAVEVINLPRQALAELAALPPSDARFHDWLVLTVEGGAAGGAPPALLGRYRVVDNVLRFEPRFPFGRGVKHRAALPQTAVQGGAPQSITFEVPAAHAESQPATVAAVYPSADLLPENQLRFYVHFSASMSRGEAYRHLDLLDAAGKPIELALLEIGEELWNPSATRLTLLIDPGRIKRGLKPREDSGPVLEAGKSYTLLVRSSFPDGNGRPMASDFRKTFRVGPPIDERVDIHSWKLAVPQVGTRQPLAVRFPRPLDRALLDRTIAVIDGHGLPVEGEIAVQDNERLWTFCPQGVWAPGKYQLSADAVLEDLAGNNVARPFEVDMTETNTARVPSESFALPFTIGPKAPHGATVESTSNDVAQWRQWRGPLATGVAPQSHPPLRWDEKTNIRWKAPLVGKGSSTPIVWNDRIYVTTAVNTGRQARPEELPKQDPAVKKYTQPPTTYHRFDVLCFDRNSGKEIWRRAAAERVPHEGHHSTHSYAAGSPTTDGERLYVSFGSAGVFCYDLNGIPLWSRDFGPLQTRLGWGEAVTPVWHDGKLLLNWDQESNSRLFCLNAADGRTLWTAQRDEPSTWTTPYVVAHGGVTQVILNGTNRIRSYNLADGKELWQCGGMSLNSIPSPVSDGERAYVMSGYRGFAARAIRLEARGDVTASAAVAWRHAKGTPYVPSPLLVGDRLYFTQANNALLTILEAKTGKVLLDRERLPGVNAFYASPLAAAGRIYLVDRSGVTLVIAQSDKLEVLATNRLDDAMDASPVAVGRQLFLRGEKSLYCIEEPK